MSKDNLGKCRVISMYCSALWGWDIDCPVVTLPCYPFILHPLSESFHRQIRNIRSLDTAEVLRGKEP